MEPLYAVILVYSTSYALQIEKLLQRNGITTKLIPVPRHLSSDCGVCVRILRAEQEKAVQHLQESQSEYASIHPLADHDEN
jgi:hypothetical protein